MANTNAPFGFKEWSGGMGGAAPNYALITRQIAYDDSTAIFTGDPVKSLDTGYVAQWTAATAVSQLAGIFVGCKYLSSSAGRVVWNNYWPGSDVASGNEVTAFLIPCNLAVPATFLVQSSGSAITFADIGLCGDVSVAAGSTTTGRSACTLNQGTLAATATFPFRIVGLYSDAAPPGSPGTDDTSSYNWVIVAANVSGAGSTGI